MVQLQKDLKDIEATGTRVVGVSFDSVEKLKKFSDAQKISFLLLSDEGSKTIKAYGLHDKKGYAKPGTYLIDKTGTIKADFFIKGYALRHKNTDLIEAAKKIQ